MNKRDISILADALASAFRPVMQKQTAATAWFAAIEAVADGLEKCNGDFDRAAFLSACRVVPALTPDDLVPPEE